MLVNSSGYTKEKQKPLEELIQKYIKLENPVKLKANYTIFIYINLTSQRLLKLKNTGA